MDSARLAKISRLKKQAVRGSAELMGRVQEARNRIADKVRNASRDPKFVAYRAKREELFGEVSGYYERLSVELDTWLKELTEKQALDWHKAALSDLHATPGAVRASAERFSRERVLKYWELIHPNNAANLTATFTTEMAKRDIQALRQSFVSTWRQGDLEGWTLRQRSKELQSAWDTAAGNMSSDRFIDASGRPWANAQYLQMLTRTTSARVARESYLDTLIADGDDLARIVNPGEPCDICEAWTDLIVSISGSNPNYPSYDEALAAGLFHPNCLCHTEYIDETVDAKVIDQQAAIDNPDFTCGDEETDGQYRGRITEAVAAYRAEVT